MITTLTTTIPLELRRLPQWVVWRYERRGGDKPTKVPVNPLTLRMAASDNRSSWGSYRDAYHARSRHRIEGIGFVFTPSDPYVGIDLDGCIESGVIHPAAEAIVESFATYAEVSPSGTGIKLFTRATKPPHTGCCVSGEKAAKYGCTRIEIYDRLRFFAVTGNVIGASHITDGNSQLASLCRALWAIRSARPVPADTNVALSDREKRCAAYVRKVCQAAISGQGGHNATLRVACEAFRFGLDREGAQRILEMFNETKCVPPWSPKELLHKIACAEKKVTADGEIGCRLTKRSR